MMQTEETPQPKPTTRKQRAQQYRVTRQLCRLIQDQAQLDEILSEANPFERQAMLNHMKRHLRFPILPIH